jgi:hypothetical protein
MYKWTIWAHSPATNQTLNQVNLETANVELTETTAQQWADAFAEQCNQAGRLQAQDWRGHVKYELTGVESLPEYLFNRPVH